MPNERNAFDLSELLSDARNADQIERNREQRLSKVDLSGRPAPKDVRVKLNSGLTIRCDVRYDGINPDGDRRFVVLAEFDWENYEPRKLIVGEYPRDVTLIFRVPNTPADYDARVSAQLELVAHKVIEVS